MGLEDVDRLERRDPSAAKQVVDAVGVHPDRTDEVVGGDESDDVA
jgi:hypothetical protein